MYKKAVLYAAIVVAMIIPALAQAPAGGPPGGPSSPPFVLNSPAFSDGGVIPVKYGQGNTENPNLSPPLNWTNVPAAAQSFTLLVHDLDTAGQHNVLDNTHWMIFNIPATAHGLPEGVPNGPAGPNGSVQVHGAGVGYRGFGYGGPTYHHYVFELYALDNTLALDASATRDDVIKAMNGHVVGKASMFGLFHR